jgi:hypothetical protein
MSYHVAITRERKGTDAAIGLDEWVAFIRASADLSEVAATGAADTDKFNKSNHAVHVRGREDTWLGWSDGEVWTKNPDQALLEYMISIAPALGARVRGDEGEYYRTIDDYHYEDENGEISAADWAERKSASRRHDKVRLVLKYIIFYAVIFAAAVTYRKFVA